jgi:hypothetical protein
MVRAAIFKDSDAPVLVTKEELLVEVEGEVEKFSNYMSSLEDWRARGALNSPEKALLRTYLVQKLQGKLLPPSPTKAKADFEARLLDKHVKYEDLCSSCQDALGRIWDYIKEWKREIKQQFGPTVPENHAVPLNPAPDYSPPKPHSLAANSKK